MERVEQYEIWVERNGVWELAGAFADLEVASAMAQARPNRIQLVQAVYERGKLVAKEVLAELGAVRQK